ERRREAPSFFFVDIQPGQRERFESIVRDVSGITPAVTPVVRARLAALDGHAITRALVEQRRGRGDEGIGYFTRDYVLTAASARPRATWPPRESRRTPRPPCRTRSCRRFPT